MDASCKLAAAAAVPSERQEGHRVTSGCVSYPVFRPTGNIGDSNRGCSSRAADIERNSLLLHRSSVRSVQCDKAGDVCML
jgi:hypothetical protein